MTTCVSLGWILTAIIECFQILTPSVWFWANVFVDNIQTNRKELVFFIFNDLVPIQNILEFEKLQCQILPMCEQMAF